MRELVNLNTNDGKFAIFVWRFSPHWVVKFTIVYSTNNKTLCESIVWELSLYSVYRTFHSKNRNKYGINPQSARRKPYYHTKYGENTIKFSPCGTSTQKPLRGSGSCDAIQILPHVAP